MKLLVTDDVLRDVDSNSLVLRVVPPQQAEQTTSPPSAVSAPVVIQPPSALKELPVYDDEREAKAVARAVDLVDRDREQQAKQLAALKDAERLSELSAAREAFARERSSLEQQLAAAERRAEQLELDMSALKCAAEAKLERDAGAKTADGALEVRKAALVLHFSLRPINQKLRSCCAPSWRATRRSARSSSAACGPCRRTSWRC